MKNSIKKLTDFPYQKIHPHKLIYIASLCAREFAESARMLGCMYPGSKNVQKFLSEELQTNNLGGGVGDHYSFLTRNMLKHNITGDLKSFIAFEKCFSIVAHMSPIERAMTVVSREGNLPAMFTSMLSKHRWPHFFTTYLTEHIHLDSKLGGHAGLLKEIYVDPKIEYMFWKARIAMIRDLC